MSKTFYYDYFALKDIDPSEWSDSFFWPVPRETTTKITCDLKNELSRMVSMLGFTFAGDCLLIAHLLPETSIKVINHLLAVNRVHSAGYKIKHSNMLSVVPMLMNPSGGVAFEHENIFTMRLSQFPRRQLRIARYIEHSIEYNIQRGRRDFFHQITGDILAFSNDNVIRRPYTNSIDSWIRLTVMEMWLSGGLGKASIAQCDELKVIANEYINFVVEYAKTSFGLTLPLQIENALRSHAERYLLYIAGLFVTLSLKVARRSIRRLLSPAAGSAFPRALSLAVRNEGGKVTGFPHGYFICHHKGSRKALHEFATVDEFVAYTSGSVNLFEKNVRLNPPPRNNPITFPHENNTDLLEQWNKFSEKPLTSRIQTVMVLELSLIPEWAGYYVAESMVNFHFYYRICELLGRKGYKVLFKRRPKDPTWKGVDIFECLPNVEIIYDSFQNPSVLDLADAYIIQYGMSSTLFQAMCTNKTVIYADAGWEDWFPDVRKLMEKRCDILHCHYDEYNRACFNETELFDILEKKPTSPNNEFMTKYLFP